MSKAEERSKEIMQAALDYANNLDDIKPTDGFRRNLCILLGQAFMNGAELADEHQAEKDLEVTWKDIEKITDIWDDLHEDETVYSKTGCDTPEFYQEILKRFKETKDESKR